GRSQVSAAASRTLTASAVTSLPVPSPGSTAMRCGRRCEGGSELIPEMLARPARPHPNPSPEGEGLKNSFFIPPLLQERGPGGEVARRLRPPEEAHHAPRRRMRHGGSD